MDRGAFFPRPLSQFPGEGLREGKPLHVGPGITALTHGRGGSGRCRLLILAGHSVPNLHAPQDGILRSGQGQFFERAANHRMERVASGERTRHSVRD